MRINITVNCHLPPARMAITRKVMEDKCWPACGQQRPSGTVDGNINRYGHCGEQYGGPSKKLKLELPYDPAIPFLGIYPKAMTTLTQKDICAPWPLKCYLQQARHGDNLDVQDG